MVAGRVTEGAWGGLGGVKRGLLDPYRALFVPLEVLYGTKFGPKHHRTVQRTFSRDLVKLLDHGVTALNAEQ